MLDLVRLRAFVVLLDWGSRGKGPLPLFVSCGANNNSGGNNTQKFVNTQSHRLVCQECIQAFSIVLPNLFDVFKKCPQMVPRPTRDLRVLRTAFKHPKSRLSTSIDQTLSIIQILSRTLALSPSLYCASGSIRVMVRPRKYKTEKEQREAARKRRREWYHRNKDKESAKALTRYHRIHNVDFKPKVQSSKPHISSAVHDKQYEEQQPVLANSDMFPTFKRLNTRAMLNAAEEALRTWHHNGLNINDEISNAQHILDMWTSGSLFTWGSALYLTTELSTDATRTETELQPYLKLGQDLQERFETISRRSFTCDPSGVVGTWDAAQFVQRQIARAVDNVPEATIVLLACFWPSDHVDCHCSAAISGVPTPVSHETAIHPWDTDYWNDIYPPDRPAHLRHIPVYPHVTPSPPDGQSQFDSLYPPSQPSQYHVAQLSQDPSFPSPPPSVKLPTDLDVDISSRRFRTSRANGDTLDADQIILFTRQSTSPRGSPRGPPVTVVFKGAAFLTHFKRVLPTFLENKFAFYDDINVTIRNRLNAAIIARSFDTPPPSFGQIVSIPQITILVTALVEQHGGAGLISTFSWRKPGEILHTDVIATSVLRRYLNDDTAVRAGNIFDEIEDDDEIPELKDFDFDLDEIEDSSD
ncbi:hypothetical protein BD410DRAFT_809992 [Rickenella mellea]|uniref:Uncharacterized protein n=1 Tax=Rickenella mellea TaxID=50990 RepID=A0A4Y7PFD3_9AGAM|nr:hypothetical protein BD410DRAFT_809992 [Rickenella mellea]